MVFFNWVFCVINFMFIYVFDVIYSCFIKKNNIFFYLYLIKVMVSISNSKRERGGAFDRGGGWWACEGMGRSWGGCQGSQVSNLFEDWENLRRPLNIATHFALYFEIINVFLTFMSYYEKILCSQVSCSNLINVVFQPFFSNFEEYFCFQGIPRYHANY